MAFGEAAARGHIRDLFDKLDADKDGGLTWNELEENIGKIDPKKAKTMMDLADTDTDDRIDLEEFCEFVTLVLRAEKLSFALLERRHIEHFYELFGTTFKN